MNERPAPWRAVVVSACALLIMLTRTPARAGDRVVLLGGDALSGRIVEQTDANIIFEHAVLGRMVIERSKIESLILEGAAPPAEPAGDALASPRPDAPDATSAVEESLPPQSIWKTRFEAGLNGSEGRTEKLDGRINFLTQRRTEETRFAFDINYRTATSRGDRTQNKFDAGAIHDWYWKESPWLAFAQGRIELDEFADYDSRYSAGGGIGYTFVKDDRTELVGRIGLGGSLENGGPNDGDLTPEGIIKVDLSHKLTEITSLTAAAEYYPDLSRLGDYRAILSAAIETKLSATSPASLKFGVRQEFEEREHSEQEDLLEFFGLFVVEF